MKFLYPLLVVLLAVFAVAPLEYPGAFQSHTGLSAVYNLINLDQNSAQFFNWAPTFGAAFDLFRTDGALPYLIAEIFHRVGFSYLDSVKLVYALAWMTSGLTLFALARKFFSDAGALLAATVYVYLPYHLATVYVRGAFAESVAWALFPIIQLAIINLQIADRKQLAAACLLVAACFLSQPGLAILFAPVAFAIAVALRQSEWKQPLAAIVGGLLLGALLYIPTILRYGVNIARDGFNASFVLPFQLFSSLWGFGASTGNFLDQFPFQLGVVPVGLAIIAVALAWRATAIELNSTANAEKSQLAADSDPDEMGVSNDRRNYTRRVVALFLVAALVLTLLTFEIAAPLWNGLSIFVTAPWQLLAFVGLALAFAAGATLEFNARLARPTMLAVFVALPIVASYGYLAPRFLDFTPTRPQIGIFGNHEIALLDYRIVGPLRHGATVRVQLTWQALRQVNHDYTVFVHAVNDDGKTYAQEDAKPQDGAFPTTKWQVGQVVADTHTIQIDVDGPSEGYHLELGLYQAANGDRATLDVNPSTNQLLLPRPGDPEPIVTDQVRPKQ